MVRKDNATREDARRILKNGILDMSIARLIQMSQFGLMGNIEVHNGIALAENVFNQISYDEKSNIISFSIEESESRYGVISFLIDAIAEISGYEDEENPDEYLHVKILLEGNTNMDIKILY